jgi:post-segregation antitoxin (ccd killing protein)
MDDAPKVRMEVELDKDLIDLAAEAGLDLNEVADRALQRALGSERLETIPRYAARRRQFQKDIQDEIAWYNAHIERDGLFSASIGKEVLEAGKEAADERARRWEEENAEAIRESNEELRRNGLWSDRYRLF